VRAVLPKNKRKPTRKPPGDFVMAELVTKTDLQAALLSLETRLDAKIGGLEAKIGGLKADIGGLEAKIENQPLRLAIRLGIMLAAGIAALAAIIKLAP
jgi:hypothetical protein